MDTHIRGEKTNVILLLEHFHSIGQSVMTEIVQVDKICPVS